MLTKLAVKTRIVGRATLDWLISIYLRLRWRGSKPESRKLYLDIEAVPFGRYLYLRVKFFDQQGWQVVAPASPALYRSLRSETYASWLLEQGLLRFSNSPSDATIVLGRGGIPLSADVFTALLDNDNTASWFIVPMAQHPQMYRYGYWNAEVDVREQLRC